MRCRGLWSFAVIATLASATFAAELPKSDEDETFDVEPPLLIPNRDPENEPQGVTATASTPAKDAERIKRELDRATRNAAGAERLFKIGVLAKAEVEQRMLRVVRLQSDLAAAQLATIQEETRAQEARAAANEVPPEERVQAERKLAQAVQAADSAAAKRERAELEAAEINLKRQQKLTALGIGRKSELVRAEEKLAELKATKN
jgi:hypothetical protein